MFVDKVTNRLLYLLLLFICILMLVLIPFLNDTSITRLELIGNTNIINNTYYQNLANLTTEMYSESVEGVLTNNRLNKVNLTAMTWAHAVNSQQKLTDALNSNIDFIEADIVLGKVNNTGPDLPIMAHPPDRTSDLSLDSFLLQIKSYNNNHTEEMKGVKLDFKTIEVFEGALGILKEKIPEMTYPIWLNADIVSGPVKEVITTPVNPKKFFSGCTQFKKVVLSVGWTTKWSTTVSDGSYTRKYIETMLEALKNNNVTKTGQPITFPVRAGIAANSLDELHYLLKAVNITNDCTLTIWSSQNDFVNINKLRKLIYSFGYDRVYLDVPEDVSTKLNLARPYQVNEDNNEKN